jgi:hypothetical protein
MFDKNVDVCFLSVEHSRVILKDVDSKVTGSDYINANYVTVIKTFSARFADHCVYFVPTAFDRVPIFCRFVRFSVRSDRNC